MPKIYIFSQLPKLNKYCLRVELAPAHQVIKKNSKWIICGSTRCIPLHAAAAIENEKKSKKDYRQLVGTLLRK